MRVIYNGIDLLPIETHVFDVQPVYDDSGVDYLYTKVTIAVRAVVNGQAQVVEVPKNGPFVSYGFQDQDALLKAGNSAPRKNVEDAVTPKIVSDEGATGGNAAFNYPTVPSTNVGNPASSPLKTINPSSLRKIVRVPNAPLLTHETIRHRLTTPRGKLWIFAGPGLETLNADGVEQWGKPRIDITTDPDQTGDPNAQTPAIVCLEVPKGDLQCDCKNGPLPQAMPVVSALGDATTLVMDWSCEAYINEGPENEVNPSGALLSNRFSQVQVVDKYGYTSMVTAGVAIFRTDLIFKLLESPDQSRAVLFMPIPYGFVRENIQVQGREDVSGIGYSYRDRQVPVNFPAGPLARAASISAVHRQAISSGGDIFEGGLAAYERFLGIKANRNFARGDATKDADGGGGGDTAAAIEALTKAITSAIEAGKK